MLLTRCTPQTWGLVCSTTGESPYKRGDEYLKESRNSWICTFFLAFLWSSADYFCQQAAETEVFHSEQCQVGLLYCCRGFAVYCCLSCLSFLSNGMKTPDGVPQGSALGPPQIVIPVLVSMQMAYKWSESVWEASDILLHLQETATVVQ